MVRTQIQLTEDQSRRLKAVSARRGVSVAELIRQAVDAGLSREHDRSPDELYERALNAAGRFRSGERDISARHDFYLAEIETR
jgi:predicted DNA-binding protein